MTVPRPLLKLTPPSREADDQALEALCFFLDRSVTPRSGLELTHGELWSTILRRRLRNRYQPPATAAHWSHRHFHWRRIATTETDEQSAAHVARIWKRQPITISTHAQRKREKARALRWAGKALANLRRPYPGSVPKRLPDSTIVEVMEACMRQIAARFSEGRKVKRNTAKPR